MNDRGKLNLSVALIGLAAILILSIGAFSLVSRASGNAMPKTPIMQAGQGSGENPATPPSGKGDESTKPKSDEKPNDQTATKKEGESGAAASASTETTGAKAHDTTKTHKEQTPKDLSGLGIYYKDDEGSQVAEKTKKILEVNLPKAMQRKNDAAREFLTVNAEGRADPLYITDFIPDALRPELEGEGISGAVDKGLIDQLIETRLTTIFKYYLPIEIIGTMQNGPYKSVLMSIPGFFYGYVSEGSGTSVPLTGSERGIYFLNISIAYISEDEVAINLSATQYDWVYQRVIGTTPVTQRHFYIRRYQ